MQDVDLHINQLTVTGAGHTLIRGAIADVTTNVAFAGLLSGSSGSLVKSGAGTLTLGNGPNDAVANTFTGPTTVAGGSLVLNKRAGVPAVGGDLVITGGSVRWQAPGQLANGRNMTLRGGAVDLAGHDESIAALTTSGGTITTGGGLLTTGSLTHADGTLAVSGRFAVTETMRVGRPQYAQYSYAATAIENINLAPGIPGVSTIMGLAEDNFATIHLGTNTFNYFGIDVHGCQHAVRQFKRAWLPLARATQATTIRTWRLPPPCRPSRRSGTIGVRPARPRFRPLCWPPSRTSTAITSPTA